MKMYKIDKNNNFYIKNFDFIQIQILSLNFTIEAILIPFIVA